MKCNTSEAVTVGNDSKNKSAIGVVDFTAQVAGPVVVEVIERVVLGDRKNVEMEKTGGTGWAGWMRGGGEVMKTEHYSKVHFSNTCSRVFF